MKARFLVLGFMLLSVQMVSAQKAEVLTNKTVTDLFKAGLDNTIVISKIESSACKFDVSTAGLLSLKKDGVPADVIKAMMDKTNSKTAVPPPPSIPNKPAQKQVPQIDMVNVPCFYDSKANTITALEKKTGDIKSKLSLKDLVSPMSGDISLVIDDDKSPVRINGADTISFLVNSDKATPDAFSLYKLNTKKGKRSAVYEKDPMAKQNKDMLTFTYRKIKDDIYQIFPTVKLAPGEYCFLLEFSVARYNGKKGDVFAFGMD